MEWQNSAHPGTELTANLILNWNYYGCGDDIWGFRTPFKTLNKNYYSMVLLGNLYSQFSKRVVVGNLAATQRALAAISDDGQTGILLIGDFCGPEMEITLDARMLGNAADIRCLALDECRDNAETTVSIAEDGLIHLQKSQPGSAAFLLLFHLS